MEVLHWSEDGDGELSAETMRRKLEALGCTVSQYTYPPGTFFSTHTHDVDKIDGVLSGRFELTMPDGSLVLGPGDMLVIPQGTEHSARVLGGAAVISLDGVRIVHDT